MFAMDRLSEVLGVVSYIRVDDHGRPMLADGRCMKQAARHSFMSRQVWRILAVTRSQYPVRKNVYVLSTS